MKQLEYNEMILLNGGDYPAACFVAGMLAAGAFVSGWNPIGWTAGAGAVIAGAICIWGQIKVGKNSIFNMGFLPFTKYTGDFNYEKRYR